ncbi:glutamyl-tRNA synthetase [Candidatus Omnitrophus magneticus]|uniref:Glutamate--tRNA ligase n=1 Tax=Candidatus Omnitrophus magneticus TaxID=1609969 RepID=A0A0F0CLR0_9BACT|nr:glutamyl-tRNA synthetase [Candidatus Omnitrophus magneticus]
MVRVRFAPSPTGFLHLGSARTALFNWLYARHTGGKFLLRIEDTDQVRSEKRFLAEILEDLKWLGLDWDEEIVYQSNRFDVYRETAEKLIEKGLAYREGTAVIFKVEKSRVIEIDDAVHGKIVFNTDEIKDQVMIKSDGSPTYNFCCVIDDSWLEITHIIRGDDHISNTPKQIIFYEALGQKPPVFAHIPLMMGMDGAKLSKRHGAVSVEEYKKEGFLSEALANYLMLLGWASPDGKEIIPLKEAIEKFDIKNLSGVQARFDTQKFRWINSEYIMKKPIEELLPLYKKSLVEMGVNENGIDELKLKKLLELYRVRGKTVSEISSMTYCFFKDDYPVDEIAFNKYMLDDENKKILAEFSKVLEPINDFLASNIEQVCREFAGVRNLKASKIIHPTRVAISGRTEGAGLFEMMEIFGKEKVIERLLKYSS